MKTKIVRNVARCLQCNDTVESETRHHLAFCACGKMFVDGGQEYLRRGGEDLSKIEELSIIEEVKDAETAK